MRLAIFGGSFDPPHIGHLLAARDAREHLRLDLVVVVPAATQPLKVGRAIASAGDRLAMARLLVEGERGFEVSDVEVEREGLSFMVDTLGHFASVYPSAERFLLVGADVLTTFAQWRDAARVLQLARPVVLDRMDGAEAGEPLPAGLDHEAFMHLATRRIDVSSTEIRKRVAQGTSIRGLVTDNVAAYIARSGLYR